METVQSINRRGNKDSELFEVSVQLNRILVTYDTDFLLIKIPKEFPGILLIRIIPNRDRYVIPVIENLLKIIDTLDFTNNIVVLDENTVRFV